MASSSSTSADKTVFETGINALTLTSDIAENFEKLAEFLNSHSANSLVDWINSNIAYDGFNAVKMRKRILRLSKGSNLVWLIAVGIVRGNNVTRISKCMKSGIYKSMLGSCVKDLKIKDRVGGDTDAITLSRIIACFPEIASKLAHSDSIPMALDYSVLVSIHTEYPRVSRHQSCASIIPSDLKVEDLRRVFSILLIPFIKTSDVINSKNKEWLRKSPLDKATTSMVYLHNSFTSKVVSEEERKLLSSNFGITSNHGLSSVWSTVGAVCESYLRANYSYDIKQEIEA